MAGSRWGGEKPNRPRRGRWSQAEVARLKELYGLRDDDSIAKELNRPVASVRKMAEQVFPLATRRGPWTAREVQELKKYVGATTEDVIARVLGRTPEEVKRQVTELGRIQESGRWSQTEVAELKRIYGTRTNEDISIILGRSVESIEREAQELCLAKDKAFLRKLAGTPSTRMPRWAPEEIELLRKLYPEHSNLEIAQRLDRSVKSVVSKAHNLDLKKNRSRLEEMGRENVSLRYRKEGEGPEEGEAHEE